MQIKIILTILFFYTISFSAQTGGKFLVLDMDTYNMIENTNILNGGINKSVVVSSNRITKEDLKKYYLEYFLFKGKKCNRINSITDTKSNIMENYSFYTNEKEIKKEIKRLKLLQILHDDSEIKGNYNRISYETIKSLSLICNKKVIFRNKMYQKNGYIGKFKIIKIDSLNSVLTLEEK